MDVPLLVNDAIGVRPNQPAFLAVVGTPFLDLFSQVLYVVLLEKISGDARYDRLKLGHLIWKVAVADYRTAERKGVYGGEPDIARRDTDM